MRPEARDIFLANLDATAKALGGTNFQDGIDLVRKTLATLSEMFDSIRTPELAAKALDELAVTPEQESLLIQAAANGPLLLRWIITQFHDTAEGLPALPTRPPAVTGKNQVAILRYVNDLHFKQGVKLGVAKIRAAQKHHCSVRTIERYWRERERILEFGPKLHFHELLPQLITTLLADMNAEYAHTLAGAEQRRCDLKI